MRIPIIVLTILLSLTFVALGFQKVTGERSMRERMDHLGVSVGLTRILGVLEFAAVAGLLIGLFWFWPLAVAAATGLVLQLIGATIYHARAKDPANVVSMPVVFALLSAALAVLHVLNA